jgi:hypothetical protein
MITVEVINQKNTQKYLPVRILKYINKPICKKSTGGNIFRKSACWIPHNHRTYFYASILITSMPLDSVNLEFIVLIIKHFPEESPISSIQYTAEFNWTIFHQYNGKYFSSASIFERLF